MSRGSSLTGCGNNSPEDGAASDDGVSSVRLNDLGKDIHRLWVLDHTNVVLAALVPSVVQVANKILSCRWLTKSSRIKCCKSCR